MGIAHGSGAFCESLITYRLMSEIFNAASLAFAISASWFSSMEGWVWTLNLIGIHRLWL